ncbi:MAG: Hsp70 family protein, partial [Acidobacteriaceae bacterium]|nr:Hsp70 family protein [Acidobacteriaceae bacterium]
EAMIRESFEKAEEDMRERQVREARVEADNILAATEKARKNPAWSSLNASEQNAIEIAIRDLQSVYHSGDHHTINDKIEALNRATQALAENMMNTAVRGALKGTKVE